MKWVVSSKSAPPLGEWPVPDCEPATVAALKSGKRCVSVSSGLSEDCF